VEREGQHLHFRSHPSEEEWEAYALGRASTKSAEKLEEHLLGCPQCQVTLEHADEFVQAMRSAASPAREEWRASQSPAWFPAWPRLTWRPRLAALALAASIALTLSVAVTWQKTSPAPTPAYIKLAAFRDGNIFKAPSGKPLELAISPPDPPSRVYFVEIVSSDGATVWTGTPTIADGMLHASVSPGLAQGSYWARLYGADRVLILEAALRAE
jgi:hypothetical protein